MSTSSKIGGVMMVVFLGLLFSSGTNWVSAQEQKKEKADDVQERGLRDMPPKVPPTLVDLLPVWISDNCATNAHGQLLVTILNVGTVVAPATVLNVEFTESGTNYNYGNVQSNVPPLPALVAVHIPVTIPRACLEYRTRIGSIDLFHCALSITVDYTRLVNEVGGPAPTFAEQNNQVFGKCIL